MQGMDTVLSSLQSQYRREQQQQAGLQAAAEHHARSVADRDDYVRDIAALCGFSELTGTSGLSADDLARFAQNRHSLHHHHCLACCDCKCGFRPSVRDIAEWLSSRCCIIQALLDCLHPSVPTLDSVIVFFFSQLHGRFMWMPAWS